MRKVQEEGAQGTVRLWANDAPNPSPVGSGRITSALTESEEEMIVIGLEESGRRGWPSGSEEVKLMVNVFDSF